MTATKKQNTKKTRISINSTLLLRIVTMLNLILTKNISIEHMPKLLGADAQILYCPGHPACRCGNE